MMEYMMEHFMLGFMASSGWSISLKTESSLSFFWSKYIWWIQSANCYWRRRLYEGSAGFLKKGWS